MQKTLERIPRKLLTIGGFGQALALSGADSHGYNQASDVLVTQTVDAVDYNSMWADYQRAVQLHNSQRAGIVSFLTFDVSSPSEQVTQLSGAKFEKATEYGQPRGIRQTPASFFLGYTFDQWDVAERFTYQFLLNATASQVDALFNSVLEADSQLIFVEVLKALFINTNRTADINSQSYNVYALYNADGTVPPTYKSNTFDGTHTHYMASGANTIDSTDLDDLIEQLRHHGYSSVNNVQLVIGVNSREGKTIRGFRIATGASYDFIPSQGNAFPLVLQPGETISGQAPANTYKGLNVIGSYGEALIIEDDNFPPGYVVIVGTGGVDNLQNPVGFRQHSDARQRGLRLIKGPDNAYPLTDAYYMRAFGTGIRQRGGAAVMKITTGSYAPPTQYLY